MISATVSFSTASISNKKAQLSLTNPRDAKACQKLLEFDVLTTLSLTILAYLHSFSCCCVRNLRNPEKFTENSRSSKVIDPGANRKPICDLLFVINSNFSRICYRFEIFTVKDRQESPAIADKPARRESVPKIASIRRAYNVVADNTGLSSFV